MEKGVQVPGNLSHEVDKNGVATIEFGHPSSNSLSRVLMKELGNKLAEVGRREDVHLIVLKSSGNRAFCSGANFDELVAIDTLEEGKVFFSGVADLINAIRTCPKLVIAQIQGKAVGAGVGIAATADYCFATAEAEVKLSELAVGIGPFVVGPPIRRKIGVSAFSQLALNASAFHSSSWAKEKGLYTGVYPTAEAMAAAVQAFAEKLAQYNPDALDELKKLFWEGTETWDNLLREKAAISGELAMSLFTKNAIQQFKKR